VPEGGMDREWLHSEAEKMREKVAELRQRITLSQDR